MSWVAVAIGGSAVISGYGAKRGADAQVEGNNAAIAEQARQFDQVRADTAPYRHVGTQAINTLGSIYGYNTTPYNAAPAQPTSAAPPWQYDQNVPSAEQRGRPINPDYPLGTGTERDPYIAPRLSEGEEAAANQALSTSGLNDQQQALGRAIYAGGQAPTREERDAARSGDPNSTFVPNPEWSYGSGLNPYIRREPLADGAGAAELGWTEPHPSGGKVSGAGFQDGQVAGLPQQAPPAGQQGGQPGQPDYSHFFKSPDYTFRRDEGNRDIGQSFAARGAGQSGNALRALTEFNSNLAAGEFGNYFNRQAALAGIGQTATNTSAYAGANAANNTSRYMSNSGNARASGVHGVGNAINAGVGNWLYAKGNNII